MTTKQNEIREEREGEREGGGRGDVYGRNERGRKEKINPPKVERPHARAIGPE